VLKHRLISGSILILLLWAIIWFDGWLDGVKLSGIWPALFAGKDHFPRGLAIFALALLIAPMAAFELSAIFQAQGILTRRWLTALAVLLGLIISYAIPMQTEAITAVAIVASGLILAFVTAMIVFSRRQNVSGVMAAAGAVVFAMLYLGLMLGFLLALRRTHSAWWIVGIILTTKAGDIGAYFTGRAIGRHKLIPWLSPGKTWEGLLGGVLVGALVGMGFAAMSHGLSGPHDHVPLWIGLVCGSVFAIVGLFGDLTVSLFKRGAGLKDSSSVLPGMGGVLDVLDSPLMVAPVAYWMLTILPSI